MKPPTNNTPPQGYKMTELGALPEEWEVVRLGEVADFFIGRTPKRAEKSYWDNGKYSWISIADMKDFGFISKTSEKVSQLAFEKIFKENIVPKGTLIMSFKLTIGRTAILNIDALHNEAIISIYPKGELLKEFLFYFLPTIDFSNYYDNVVKGKTLNSSKIKNLLLPLPPLPEQQKIAAVLSAVQEAKEKTEAVIAAAKALKKSMMKHLFTYGPVSPEEVEKVPLKETEIGPVPEDWEVVKLGDTFEFSKKPRNLKIKKDDFVPFIPMEMISETNKSIKSWEEKRNSEISSSSFVFRNDIIIAKITPSFENGKQAILDNLPTDFGYATTEIWALHPAKNVKAITYYLHYYLKINSIRKILAGKMEGSTGRQRLPKHVLENLPIPLPPLPTQQKIASILSAIDAKIEAEENKKKALEELFKSLLHNLMNAKIRVNQLKVSS
ncbi:MAG TPA: restriction endonuclease subunit S [Candidatus Marinimicrobia bacterium]|jgi:type I restriction enzyme S subunit|nr:restriction endonuclease subunit S [Candidatus Neomarinimicrobiota bacterium]